MYFLRISHDSGKVQTVKLVINQTNQIRKEGIETNFSGPGIPFVAQIFSDQVK